MDARLTSFYKVLFAKALPPLPRLALSRVLLVSTAIVTLAHPINSYSQTYFISDELTIPLRSGPSRDHRIVTFLKSGATVISTDNPGETNEWLEVQVKNRKGWLLREHVRTTPTHKMQLEALEAQMTSLKTQSSNQQQQLDEANAQISALEESLKRAQSNLTQTRTELTDLQSLTSDTIAVNSRNTELTEKISLLEIREQQLTMENHDLRNDQRRQGMLQGALAVIAGALLAVVIPRLTHKKQRSNWF